MLGARRGRGGEAYFVTDGEPVVFREFVGELLETQGVEAPRRLDTDLPSPPPLSAGSEAAWRLLPLGGEPLLPRASLYWVSSQECTIEIGKARSRQLGYEPVVSQAEGLAELRG